MSPRTRLTTVKENRSLRSKKVCIVENVRISLTRCDNTNKQSRSNKHKPSKKNIVKIDGTVLTPTNSSKLEEKQVRQLSPTKKKSTNSEEKSPAFKKPTTVENNVRKPNSKGNTTKTVNKDKQSPKKPAALKNIKQSPIKTNIIHNDTSASEVRIKKPFLKKGLESKVKQQIRLGRIFINPTFPSKTVFKRQTHSGDKEENQGQLVTTDNETELNNNVVKRVQPKLVLRKVDQQTERPTREKRTILRHL